MFTCLKYHNFAANLTNNSKKAKIMRASNILAACLLFMCASLMSAQPAPVPIEPEIKDNQGLDQGGGNKAPVQTPTVTIEDYTLTFSAPCVGCMVELMQGDVVVYTAFVDANGEVEIPSTLSGTFQLRLYYADIIFVGEFEL